MATLAEWEEKLKIRVPTIQLLGELGLTRQETEEIGLGIQNLVTKFGFDRTTSRLKSKYPCTFAAYLVFQGIFGFDHGNYWARVCQVTGIPYDPNYTPIWGRAFLEILQQLGFHYRFGGNRYVGSILGHGGIPLYSLADFFGLLLQPSVTRVDWAATDTQELIQEWLSRSYLQFADKSIRRFFENGGIVAVDFVDRCREMAREYAEFRETPSAGELGLSQEVVSRYREWVEHVQVTAAADVFRVRRPQLLFEPWGMGVELVLPEQQIPISSARASFGWHVTMNGKTESLPVPLYRKGGILKTESAILPLESPETIYQVSFTMDGEPQREWEQESLSDSSLFIFDPDTGKAIRYESGLDLARCWAVFPPEISLEPEPARESFVSEVLPALPWEWHTWHAAELDLTAISAIQVQGREVQDEISIRNAQRFGAELHGQLAPSTVIHSAPLYLGRPPRLRIPAITQSGPSGSLAKWVLELTSEGETDPPVRLKKSLSELGHCLEWQPDGLDVLLEHPFLLGSSPMGRYRLHLRGIVGEMAQFRFAVLDKLSVLQEDLAEKALTGVERDKDSLVEIGLRDRLEFFESSAQVKMSESTVNENGRCYQIVASSTVDTVSLRVLRELADRRVVSVPIDLTIYRPRWLFALAPSRITHRDWKSELVSISMQELEQSDSPSLLLDLPPHEEELWVRLRLIGARDEELQSLEPVSTHHVTRYYRFDLRMIKDTLRASEMPIIRGILEIQSTKKTSLPAIAIKQGIVVQEFMIDASSKDQEIDIRCKWQPDVRLKGRYLCFWSLSRPWSDPFGVSVPDHVRSTFDTKLSSAEVIAGVYLVELTIYDPWLSTVLPRPLPDSDNVTRVILGDPEERYQALLIETPRDESEYAKLCERALLMHYAGDARVDDALQQCLRNFDRASYRQIILLIETFHAHLASKALKLKLYSYNRLKQMLARHASGELDGEEMRRYFLEFPPNAINNPQVALALLDAPVMELRFAAAKQLVKQGSIEGFEAVITWLERSKITLEEAGNLFSSNLHFVRETLRDVEPTTEMVELCNALAKRFPLDFGVIFIKPGVWIKSQAGWGKLNQIQDYEGKPIDVIPFDESAEGYRYFVTVRPNEDALEIVIDTFKGKLIFSQLPVHACIRCDEYIAADYSDVTRKHHPHAHPGTHSGFRMIRTGEIPLSSDLRFTITPLDSV